MHNITPAFKAHLASDTQTLCTIWKVTRTDGKTFGYTDFDSNITYDNQLYMSSISYSSSAIKSGSAMTVDNMDIKAPLGNVSTSIRDVITELSQMTDSDIQAGIWDYAKIVILQVNYEDLSPTMGHLFKRSGTIGQITTGRNTVNTELRGKQQKLQQQIGRVYTAGCTANLGDKNCRVNLANYIFNGSVTKTIDQHSWLDSSLTQTNSVYKKSIVEISKETQAKITVNAHGLSGGEQVTFSGITAMPEINGRTFAITYADANNFYIEFDTTKYDNVANNGEITKFTISEYFKEGVVERLTGNNKGLIHPVKNYSPGYVFLYDNLVYEIQVGDTYKITAGCDKLASTCNDRFNNIINFYGFNLIPGQDRTMSGT